MKYSPLLCGAIAVASFGMGLGTAWWAPNPMRRFAR